MAFRAKNLRSPAVGFAPILPRRVRLLILGTLPSVASLAQQQYYAHPRNAFWPIMGELLGFDPALDYERRLRYLRRGGIALWDVCHSARRVGSLDAAIQRRGLMTNDISGLLTNHPNISAIFFNGIAAASLFKQRVLPALAPETQHIVRVTLPSTSPANASLTLQHKRQAWSRITDYLA
jgi:double-stranded uracil-DNA glycosylase